MNTIEVNEEICVPETPKTFLVFTVSSEDGLNFLDEDENGDYFQTQTLPKRLIFSASAPANKFYEELKQRSKETTTDSNGVRRPLNDISRILKLSDKNPDVMATISLREIEFNHIDQFSVHGRIQKPTGYTYD